MRTIADHDHEVQRPRIAAKQPQKIQQKPLAIVRLPSRFVSQIQPTSIYAYTDKLQIWLKKPLTRAQISAFRNPGSVHIHNQPARFDRSFRQRLQLHQPTDDVLRRLSKLKDAYPNYVELALDLVFDSEVERDEAFAFIDRYLIKKHHRRDHGIRHVNGVTRYSGPRSAPNVLAVYADRECRISGEVYCCHLEWRIRGRAALRRCGIETVDDLLKFAHQAFWQKRLLLATFDRRKLGRMHRNSFRRRRRRTVAVARSGFRYNVDHSTAALLCNVFGSTQKMLDHFSSKFRVRDGLIPIDAQHLLPRSGTTPSYDRSEQLTDIPRNPMI
jgi:hypothetical protein